MNGSVDAQPAVLREPRRRRSSLLDRWIQEQRFSTASSSRNSHSSELDDAFDTAGFPQPPQRVGAPANAYLAYPDIRPRHDLFDDADTVESYEFLHDHEIAESTSAAAVEVEPILKHTRSTSKLQASLRNLRIAIPFKAGSSAHGRAATTPSKTRLSIFQSSNHPRHEASSPSPRTSPLPATPPNKLGHGRGSSLSLSLLGSASPFSSMSTARSPGQNQFPYSSGLRLDDSPNQFLTPNPSKWRPSVLGHFTGSSSSPESHLHPDDLDIAPSRPSFSSTYTSTSGVSDVLSSPNTQYSAGPGQRPKFRSGMSSNTAYTSTDNSREDECLCLHSAASRSTNDIPSRTRALSNSTLLSFSRSKAGGSSTPGRTPSCSHTRMSPSVSHSEWSEKDHHSLSSPPSRTDTADHSKPFEVYAAPTHGKALSIIGSTKASSLIGSAKPPSIIGSTRTPSLIGSTRSSKQKKLVVGGIAAGDDVRVDGMRRWCESFGEVKRIVRMPNGQLVFEWKDSSVADTVCRLRAGVNIPGVGSVHISWCNDKKR
ncbi:hypothetical protein BDV98DRAFT_583999 [Pterulicium gracile]|uniref:RRM domain-containing protein n=1 Tax=Pterulicium gracile TaxID=1884261 RepID=A0A5C3QMR4_9AGAR|nr:hypothetical protein BDV98DRAFT_583999 [Pterula gracilis]